MRITDSLSTSLLTPQGSNSFVRDFDYTLNPYGGCAFACAYCYVPSLLRGRAGSLGGWGSYVEVRRRAPAVLARQRHKLSARSFFCASATDPWQPVERHARITRALLEILIDVPFSFGLFSTRAPLVLRDLDLLQAMAGRIEVGVSVLTDLEALRRVVEPRNPPAAQRIAAARALREAGIRTRLHISPCLPSSDGFIARAAEAADWVWLDWPAHISPGWAALFRTHGLAEWLSRGRVEQEADRWRAALGAERVGLGRDDFAGISR